MLKQRSLVGKLTLMKKTRLALCALIISAGALAATPLQSIRQPIEGRPQAIGSFANGCIIGAQPLPSDAPCCQIMRQDQRRFYGHPELILFIQRLSRLAYNQHLGEVLVGDMAMAAGGGFSSGHVSHQSRFDVDI